MGIENNQEDNISYDKKMEKITSELYKQFEESHRLEEEIKKNLRSIGYEYN